MSDNNGMSFVYGYTGIKDIDQWYETPAAGMTGDPPFTFGACFVVDQTENAVQGTQLGVFGNWDSDTGWGIAVDDDWEQALTNQEINVYIGQTTLTAGQSGGTGDKISSGVGKCLFVVCTCNAYLGTAELWLNGQIVDTDTDPETALSNTNVELGSLPDAGIDVLASGGISLAFYTNSVLSDDAIVALYKSLQYQGRWPETLYVPEPLFPLSGPGSGIVAYDESISIDYVWQTYHLRDVYANRPILDYSPLLVNWSAADFNTWNSRGAAATAKTFTVTENAPSLYMAYQSRLDWAGIVPAHQDDPQ